MSESSYPRPEAAAPWDREIPEKVLAFYLESVCSYPAWKTMCPNYIHPDVKDVRELGYHATLLATAQSEYVFTFSTKTTFIYEIEEEVRTGQLEVRCGDEVVLHVGASCADDAEGKPEWVARSVEIFRDGDWVSDLLQLAARQRQHEHERLKQETTERQRDAQELTRLRQKFGIKESPASPIQHSVRAKPLQRRGWLRFWKNRTG